MKRDNTGFNTILSAVAVVGRFAFLMRTMAGKLIVVLVAGLAQIPGLAIFIHDIFVVKAGGAGIGFLEYLVPVSSALLYEASIFFLVINERERLSVPMIIGSVYMNFVSYTGKFISLDQVWQNGNIQQWMTVGAILFLSITPAYIIKVFSSMIVSDIQGNMSQMIEASKDMLSKQAADMKSQVEAFYKKDHSTLSTTRPSFEVKRAS